MDENGNGDGKKQRRSNGQFAKGNGLGFQPGDPRINRRGRQPSIVTEMRRIADDMVDVEGVGRVTVTRAIAEVIKERALAGDPKFVDLYVNRLDGKEVERIGGVDGGPLEIELTDQQRARVESLVGRLMG